MFMLRISMPKVYLKFIQNAYQARIGKIQPMKETA